MCRIITWVTLCATANLWDTKHRFILTRFSAATGCGETNREILKACRPLDSIQSLNIDSIPAFEVPVHRRGVVVNYMATSPSGVSLARKLRILIVEDNAATRLAMSRLMRDAGAEVITARDGEEGLGYLLTQHFDVLLTDLRMPVMDGFELLQIGRASCRERV